MPVTSTSDCHATRYERLRDNLEGPSYFVMKYRHPEVIMGTSFRCIERINRRRGKQEENSKSQTRLSRFKIADNTAVFLPGC